MRPDKGKRNQCLLASRRPRRYAGFMPRSFRSHDAPLPDGPQQQIDRICDEFEAACASGSQPRIEEYLSQAPESLQASLFRELLGLELDYLADQAIVAAPEDYASRFPQWAEIVHEVCSSLARGTPRQGSADDTL